MFCGTGTDDFGLRYRPIQTNTLEMADPGKRAPVEEGGDAYARMHGSCSKGRGSQSGWTPCPICYSNRASPPVTLLDARDFTDEVICRVIRSIKSRKSLKLFSHGRGLAAHLHSVHTPWKPGNAELKRRRGILRRRKNEEARLTAVVDEPGQEGREKKRRKLAPKFEENGAEPTEKDVLLWDRRVAQIVAVVALEAKEGGDKVHKGLGHDRSGNEYKSYRESLPPFLDAAASGDLDGLKVCVQGRKGESQDDHVRQLLNLRDRNGSLALHWAAGGGHIEALTYLLDLQDSVCKNRAGAICDYGRRAERRRDGKTALHYAARNAQNNAIDVLMARANATSIDVTSNDGSTPLMLACYGGHLSTVKHLVDKYNANLFVTNDWNCGVSHWTAMSLGHSGEREVTEICEYLAKKGVDFTYRQKQGHSPLHKAASKKNRHVILWLWTCTCIPPQKKRLMGEPDIGGNLPSDIWLSVGGCNDFYKWMKKDCGW